MPGAENASKSLMSGAEIDTNNYVKYTNVWTDLSKEYRTKMILIYFLSVSIAGNIISTEKKHE